MMLEFQHFIEFGDSWFDTNGRTRANMVMEPVSLNPEYVASVKRHKFAGGIEMCIVHMVDHGQQFIIDKTYEEMKELLATSKASALPLP